MQLAGQFSYWRINQQIWFLQFMSLLTWSMGKGQSDIMSIFCSTSHSFLSESRDPPWLNLKKCNIFLQNLIKRTWTMSKANLKYIFFHRLFQLFNNLSWLLQFKCILMFNQPIENWMQLQILQYYFILRESSDIFNA